MFTTLFNRLTTVRAALVAVSVATLILTVLPTSAHAAEPAVGVASNGAGGGWVTYANGAIVAFGGAQSLGDMASTKLNQPIVGIGSTPSHKGYWLVASDGGVFAFGDAGFFGSTGSIKLNKPVVGIASTPDAKGYWLVASDGGVFAFGNAGFYGSTGSIKLNQPVVSMSGTGSGKGYWLVAADGGIFAYGDAAFKGSAGSIKLNQPIVGMAPTSDGGGYSLVARDGGVFAYGNAKFFGSLGSSGITNIAGFVTTSTGYVLVDSSGKTYPFSSTNNTATVVNTKPPTETTTPTAPAQSGSLSVSTPEDFLGLGSRLVFSTVKSEGRAAQSITVSNTGAASINVTGVTISGAQAKDFALDSGQASSFTLTGGAKRTISVVYQPTGGGYHVIPTYLSQASLSIATNAGSPAVVSLGGYNAADYGSVWEPSLQQMVNTLGYSTNIGVTDKYQANGISPYSGSAGDEVISAYWKKADSSKSVSMYPLAHSSGQENTYASFGWYAKGSSSNNYLYAFTGPGNGDKSNDGWGQNQMLLPGTTSATRTFSPSGSFGFVDSQGNYSDDNKNGSGKWHDVRWYPARNANGVAIANTWIVSDDIGGPVNNSAKNWDYQDYVFLVTNATPDGGSNQPTSVPLEASLNAFNGNAGGVANTGFTTAQGATDTSKLGFGGGDLLLTTSNDSNTSHTNALQLGVNAATPFKVSSRLVGPFDSINAGSEQQGIYFGPDRNNYIKAEVEWNASDKSRHLTVWLEKNGSGQIVKTVQLPGGNANTIDFAIAVDPSPQAAASYNGNPIVTISYAINGGAAQTLLQDNTSVPGSWITANTPAGVVASHQEGGSQFVARFANFSVVRTY